MAKQNVAEQFVDILVRAGVQRLYGGVGRMLQMARSNLRNVPRP